MNKLHAMAVLLTLTTLTATTQAAIVTWNDNKPSNGWDRTLHQDITGDSDAVNLGAKYVAASFGHTTDVGSTYSINGVSFKALAPNTSHANDGITLQEVWGSGTSSASDTSSASAPFSSLSSSYQAILGTNSLRDGGNGNKFYNIGGLEVGKEYRLQIWANDSNLSDGDNGRTQISTGVNLTGHTFLDGNYGFNYGFSNSASTSIEGALGRIFDGTFTVDTAGTHQLISQLGKTLNAINIQEVVIPEPNSLALIGISVLGVLVSQRR